MNIFLSLRSTEGYSPLDHKMLKRVCTGFWSSLAASLINEVGVGRWLSSLDNPAELWLFKLLKAFATSCSEIGLLISWWFPSRKVLLSFSIFWTSELTCSWNTLSNAYDFETWFLSMWTSVRFLSIFSSSHSSSFDVLLTSILKIAGVAYLKLTIYLI